MQPQDMEEEMAFKAAFVAHAPGCDPRKHRATIDTPKYKMYAVVVQDQKQAVKECKALVKNEGVHSILLCPGFTHKNVAEIAEAVGEGVSICVARSDGPGNRVVAEVMAREGWFTPSSKA